MYLQMLKEFRLIKLSLMYWDIICKVMFHATCTSLIC